MQFYILSSLLVLANMLPQWQSCSINNNLQQLSSIGLFSPNVMFPLNLINYNLCSISGNFQHPCLQGKTFIFFIKLHGGKKGTKYFFFSSNCLFFNISCWTKVSGNFYYFAVLNLHLLLIHLILSKYRCLYFLFLISTFIQWSICSAIISLLFRASKSHAFSCAWNLFRVSFQVSAKT